MKQPDLTRETDITRSITNWLDTLPGCLWFKNIGTNGRKGSQRRGRPDLEVFWRGRVWLLEVKQPGKKLSPDQLEIRAAFDRAGHTMYRVESLEETQALVLEREWTEAQAGTVRLLGA